jgi:hypothetical protein
MKEDTSDDAFYPPYYDKDSGAEDFDSAADYKQQAKPPMPRLLATENQPWNILIMLFSWHLRPRCCTRIVPWC